MDSRLRGNGGVDIADLNGLYSAGKAHATGLAYLRRVLINQGRLKTWETKVFRRPLSISNLPS